MQHISNGESPCEYVCENAVLSRMRFECRCGRTGIFMRVYGIPKFVVFVVRIPNKNQTTCTCAYILNASASVDSTYGPVSTSCEEFSGCTRPLLSMSSKKFRILWGLAEDSGLIRTVRGEDCPRWTSNEIGASKWNCGKGQLVQRRHVRTYQTSFVAGLGCFAHTATSPNHQQLE
jgi:hypothetical protein